jgi:hypothetical protein
MKMLMTAIFPALFFLDIVFVLLLQLQWENNNSTLRSSNNIREEDYEYLKGSKRDDNDHWKHLCGPTILAAVDSIKN